MSYRSTQSAVVSHHRRLPWITLIALAVLVALALTACDGERIRIPSADSTPPTVEFHVSISGTSDSFVLGQDSIPISRVLSLGSRVTMIVVGRDRNGGVQNVIIRGTVTVNCKGRTPIVETVRVNNPQPGGVGSMGTTVLSTAYVFNVREWTTRCPSGTFSSMSGSFFGRARNYHMGETDSAEFRFTHP